MAVLIVVNIREYLKILIFVNNRSNLRLLKCIEAVDYTETTVQWEEWAVEDSEEDEDEDKLFSLF